MIDSQEYFAAKEAEELAGVMIERLNEWRGAISKSGIADKWWKSYNMYFGKHFARGSSHQNSEILRMGDKGELAGITVNHYRNLIKHVMTLTVNQKPAFDCRATNSDTDSIQQARLANNILESYLKTKRLGRYLKRAAEHAQVFGKGFVLCQWDPSKGSPYSTQTVTDEMGQSHQKVVYEGDIDVCTPSVFDVYVDPASEDWSKIQWACVRLFKNKFDLAAQYPLKSDDIERLQTKIESDPTSRYGLLQSFDESVDVPVYYFFHERTRSLPNGRLVIFAQDNVVLFDGPMPYRRLPLFRIVPGEIFGTTDGYTDAFDLLNIQEAINVLESTQFTNQNANGVQKIWAPEGDNIAVTQVSKGLAMIRSKQKPEPLQLTATAPEIPRNIEALVHTMETLIGINSVARGDPQALGKNASGVALSIVQSMAVQYASDFQQSWAELLEDVGTFILELLKDFASTKRMIAMAGKKNRGYMASFTKDDLKFVERVVVDLGNPMSKTVSGRYQLAEMLVNNGMIKTPQHLIEVLETGNLEAATEGIQSQLALIRSENEDMMDGKQVFAMPGDQHLLHAQEHMSILANPEVRRNSPIAKGVLDHVQSHVQQYKTQDPVFAMISGEPPAPPQGPPPGPPGPPAPPHNQGPSGPPPQAMQAPPQGPPPIPTKGAPVQPGPGAVPPMIGGH